MFNADGLLYEKDIIEGFWQVPKKVDIDTSDDIKTWVSGKRNGRCDQINIDKYHKVFYCMDNIKQDGVNAKVKTDTNTEFACSPLLFVLCDDSKPIPMKKSEVKFFLERIEFL